MQTAVSTYQEDCDMCPAESPQIELKFIRVRSFFIQEEEKTKYLRAWTSLPSIDRMMDRRFGNAALFPSASRSSLVYPSDLDVCP